MQQLENVELLLDVQLDNASKKILSNPEKCKSALLDVTVIKPKELEAFGTCITNTLKADQVRKLIASLEKQRRQRQKYIEDLKQDNTIVKVRKHDVPKKVDKILKSAKQSCCYTNKGDKLISPNAPVDDLERKDFIGVAESVEPLFCEIKRSLKNVETRITDMQDINLVISQTTTNDTTSSDFIYRQRRRRVCSSSPPSSLGDHIKNNYIYRADKEFRDLKATVCKGNKGDKIETTKCFCENCGIVGLLEECQRHPLMHELRESFPPQPETRHCTSRKTARFDEQDKTRENACISRLSQRVRLLEERLAAQEERAVPRDYFKRIITNIVKNITPKSFAGTKSEQPVYVSEVKCTATKADKGIDTRKQIYCPSFKNIKMQTQEPIHCYRTSLDINPHCPTPPKTFRRSDKSTLTDGDILYDGSTIWRWGEEILKPGIDLKNRIVNLVNEVFCKLSIEKPFPIDRKESESMFKQFQNRNVHLRVVHSNAKNIPRHGHTNEKLDSIRSIIQSVKKRSNSPDHTQYIDVGYMNPKMSEWPHRRSERREETRRAHTHSPSKPAASKNEFLKILSNAKSTQKQILWRNIWDQARANGQTRNDKITIKIPVSGADSRSSNKKDMFPSNKKDMFQMDLSLREVEEVLLKN